VHGRGDKTRKAGQEAQGRETTKQGGRAIGEGSGMAGHNQESKAGRTRQ
jgi:hypothetical protein